MNAPDPLLIPKTTDEREEASRIAALNRFTIESIQHLPRLDLLLAQAIAPRPDMAALDQSLDKTRGHLQVVGNRFDR